MSQLILGIGPGLFAVLLTFFLALIIAIIGAYLVPSAGAYIFIGCMLLPFIVFGIIVSAPRSSQPRNDIVIDKLYPLRVSLLLWLCLGVVAGFGYSIGVLTLAAPPFVMPRVKCLRKQKEELRPEWFK